MTNETDSFVNEVDEGLRREQAVSIARKYGPWILGAFIALLIGIGGWQGWRAYQVDASRRHAEQYAAAQELFQQGNLTEAKAEFERLSNEGPRVYRAMARMEHAAILVQEGDMEGAIAGFDAAAEIAPDRIMRESAQIRAAYIAADTQDFPTLRTRLQPLIDSDSSVSYLAKELLAVEAWKAGETDLARQTFEQMELALGAPDTLRQRARVALDVLGPAPQTAQTPADGAAAPAPSEGGTE
ncbi:MAG: tetratricopeptide repeat protein [Hyphomonadaceae bacterium]|nr:tetratricopeptide repeat protein [Hyphomonadaceae bacterium]